jgi:hypothetical protein
MADTLRLIDSGMDDARQEPEPNAECQWNARWNRWIKHWNSQITAYQLG